MPRFDGTGPQGFGPGTGRGMGPCGAGTRRSFGFGFRRFFAPENELTALKQEEQVLDKELQAVRKEIESLASPQK